MVMTSWEWEKAKSRLPDGFEPTTPQESCQPFWPYATWEQITSLTTFTKPDDLFKGFLWYKYALRIYRTLSKLVIQRIFIASSF